MLSSNLARVAQMFGRGEKLQNKQSDEFVFKRSDVGRTEVEIYSTSK